MNYDNSSNKDSLKNNNNEKTFFEFTDPYPPPPSQSVDYPIEDMFSESRGYFIPEGIEGETIRQISAAIILRKTRKAAALREAVRINQQTIGNDDSLELKDANKLEGDDDDGFDGMPTNNRNINGSTVSADKTTIISAVLLSEIGRDFSERLIIDGQERFAMSVLLECALLEDLEPSAVIAILARYCEVGLVVIDILITLLKRRLEYRGKGMKEEFIEASQDAGDIEPFDLFEQTSVITYFSTIKQLNSCAQMAEKKNKNKAAKKEELKKRVMDSRKDYTVYYYIF
jgi:hypothetical protein